MQAQPGLTFDDALAVSAGKRHLLLGNGFSIALKPDIFSYGALYEQADFGVAPHLKQLFDALDTRDFETIIRMLVDMAKILRVYRDAQAELTTQIEEDAAAIKNILVDAIASRHPSRPYEITLDQYRSCRSFLAHFSDGYIYTLNYDVLLYWTLMQDDVDDLDLQPDDGFRAPENNVDADYVAWLSYHSPTVYYLHGALHLFDAGHELQKYTWSRTDIPIIDQIRAALETERYPLFVSEGHSESKLTRIMHSGYLHKALRSLESIGGSLFIFGHSLHANDQHVLRAIEHSKIRRLFISLHGDPSGEVNQHIIQRAQTMHDYREARFRGRRPLDITFFDAATAHIWQ
jgi:Domain of unknown function (DUF4917)